MALLSKMLGSLNYEQEYDDEEYEQTSKISKFKKKGDPKNFVVMIKPNNVEDSREIVDELLKGSIVILNMEGLSLDIAQRIIDFSNGSIYSIDGNLKKVSQFIFILTPYEIDITGDFLEENKLNK